MNRVDRGGFTLAWYEDGDPSAPALLLGNSLGTDARLWEPLLPRLARRFRVLRYDYRGHGASDALAGPYTLTELTGDAVAGHDAAGVTRTHYAGISLGGLIGLELAARHAHRLRSLVVANTAPKIGSADAWHARADTVESDGLASLAEAIVDRWLTPAFAAAHPARRASLRAQLGTADDHGYASCCRALATPDLTADLDGINIPTAAIGGTFDVPTPPEQTCVVSQRVRGAEWVELPGAHLTCAELPAEFTDVIERTAARAGHE